MFDAGTLGVISTLLMIPAIIGIAWWAFAPRRKKRFEDAANLPFADEAGQAKSEAADKGEGSGEGSRVHTEQNPTDQETNGQSTENGDGTEKRN